MPKTALIGIAKLMRQAFASEDLNPIAQGLLNRLHLNPNDANAAMDLCTIFELGGDASLAMEFQETALSVEQIFSSPRSAIPDVLKVLAIKGRGVIMDNMPIEFLVENTSIQLQSIYVGEGIPAPSEIPEHDVAIVAVCESDSNQSLLESLGAVTESWPRPVLNKPSSIANLSREKLGAVVKGINGLVFAESKRMARGELVSLNELDTLPRLSSASTTWIIRPVNSHAGHGLDRFSNVSGLRAYLMSTSDQEFLVAPFVDYTSADGTYRKYRIALIQGEAYPVHMALSARWMVHYLNADMLDNASHRNEEAVFMERFESGFGQQHRRALRELSNQIGLDYVVLDCAETREGDLLLFEADNGAVVHSMDPIDLFPYKRPAMQRIFDAFTRLLLSAHADNRDNGRLSRCA